MRTGCIEIGRDAGACPYIDSVNTYMCMYVCMCVYEADDSCALVVVTVKIPGRHRPSIGHAAQ